MSCQNCILGQERQPSNPVFSQMQHIPHNTDNMYKYQQRAQLGCALKLRNQPRCYQHLCVLWSMCALCSGVYIYIFIWSSTWCNLQSDGSSMPGSSISSCHNSWHQVCCIDSIMPRCQSAVAQHYRVLHNDWGHDTQTKHWSEDPLCGKYTVCPITILICNPGDRK